MKPPECFYWLNLSLLCIVPPRARCVVRTADHLFAPDSRKNKKKEKRGIERGSYLYSSKKTHAQRPRADILILSKWRVLWHGAVSLSLSLSVNVCLCVSAVVLCCVGRCRHSSQVFIQPGLRTGRSPAAIGGGGGGGGGGEDGGGVAWWDNRSPVCFHRERDCTGNTCQAGDGLFPLTSSDSDALIRLYRRTV